MILPDADFITDFYVNICAWIVVVLCSPGGTFAGFTRLITTSGKLFLHNPASLSCRKWFGGHGEVFD
jgi:hypothetical protein